MTCLSSQAYFVLLNPKEFDVYEGNYFGKTPFDHRRHLRTIHVSKYLVFAIREGAKNLGGKSKTPCESKITFPQFIN